MNKTTHTIEFMNQNPHCNFCQHSYIKAFAVQCRKGCKTSYKQAKVCEHYSPTLIPIEHRSPK